MNWENIYKSAHQDCLALVNKDEAFITNFSAENTLFIRFNNSKIRQVTSVEQGNLYIELFKNHRKSSINISLSKDIEANKKLVQSSMNSLQSEVHIIDEDPNYNEVEGEEKSCIKVEGQNPSLEDVVDIFSKNMKDIDLAGYLACGEVYRGNTNSRGQFHWFESSSFNFDYSLYTKKQKAVKGSYAGSRFSKEEFLNSINESIESLNALKNEEISLEPGKYRVYLAPSAVNELLSMFNWGALSGGSYKRGDCALAALYENKEILSEKFSLREDYRLGLSHQFNELGEVTDDSTELIVGGKMTSLLVSKATEKEYGLKSNKSSSSESLRSTIIESGKLDKNSILKELDTGIYVSDLHYLNWSDRSNARVTGMTRFACVWVEDGKVMGPIRDMRFDETLYHIFGDGLLELSDFTKVFSSNDTYHMRSLGGAQVPGVLVKDFSFTL